MAFVLGCNLVSRHYYSLLEPPLPAVSFWVLPSQRRRDRRIILHDWERILD
jgi:hypothetical protein